MSKQTVRYPFVVVLITVLLMLVIAQPLAAKENTKQVEVQGTVLSIDAAAGTFQIQGEHGEVYIIVPMAGFDLSTLKVGDIVEVKGTRNDNGSVSALSIKIEQADEDQADKSEGYYCVQSDVQHPVGARLAKQHEVPYATLQGWFCEGFGWGQIKLALRTAELTGGNAADLLKARRDGQGWGQIWQSLKLIGRTKVDASPVIEDGSAKSGGAGQSDVVKAKGKPPVTGQSEVKKANGKPDVASHSNSANAKGKSDAAGQSNNGKGRK